MFYLNLICGFLNSSASMSVIYLQMMARLGNKAMEWCGKKYNGIILALSCILLEK